MSFFVYVLRSESTGRIYIGQTDNLEKRVEQHNDPDNTLSLYTRRNKGPWKLIYYEICKSRSEAMKCEKWLKTGVGIELNKLPRSKLRGFMNSEARSQNPE